MTNPFEPPSGETPEQPPQPTPAPPPYGQAPYGQAPPYRQAPPYGQGMQPYAQPAYGGPAAATRNGLGTAALVLGIIGAVAGLTLFLFILAVPLGVLAVVFGLIGRGRAKRGEASNKGAATWGFALGVVALVLSIVGVIFVVHVARVQRDCRDHATSTQQYNDCSHKY